MEHVSTRGESPALDFAATTLAGLAPDGGLYVPSRWPQLSGADFRALLDLPYPELAGTLLAELSGGQRDAATFTALARDAYAGFAHAAVTPLVQLDHRHWLLELHHGPTLAFKDLALQLLGRLFARFLGAGGPPLTIIGATSGDTGSAAIQGVAGIQGLRIFMLHPEGRVSEVQRRQMTTIDAPNVFNIALDGSFDDAQALVKALFSDPAFRARHRLSAVNSINWARLAAQTVYYVHAALRLGAPDRAVSFSVPTGNFGDVFAGHVAAEMGLPVERLMVATNENDILVRAFASGDYSRGRLTPTQSPSMDIQVSSNFERLIFDLSGRDGAATAAAMRAFEASGALRLSPAFLAAARRRFSAARIDRADMAEAMRWAHRRCGQLIDPHTAIGLAAARRMEGEVARPIVTLATAHPAKFPDAVEGITGVRPALPERLADLFSRPERMIRSPCDIAALKALIDGVGE
jgi:threonine synthase